MSVRLIVVLVLLSSVSAAAGPLLGIKPGSGDAAWEYQWQHGAMAVACGFAKVTSTTLMKIENKDCAPGYSAEDMRKLHFAMPKAVQAVKVGAITLTVALDGRGVVTVHASGPAGVDADLAKFADEGVITEVLGFYASPDPTKIVIELRWVDAELDSKDSATGIDLADALSKLASPGPAAATAAVPAGRGEITDAAIRRPAVIGGFKGKLVISKAPVATGNDDKDTIARLKKAQLKVLDGEKTDLDVKKWHFAYAAFLSKTGATDLEMDFFNGKQVVGYKNLDNVDPKNPVLTGEITIDEDEGIVPGKEYGVVILSGKDRVAVTTLTLK